MESNTTQATYDEYFKPLDKLRFFPIAIVPQKAVDFITERLNNVIREDKDVLSYCILEEELTPEVFKLYIMIPEELLSTAEVSIKLNKLLERLEALQRKTT